MDFSWQWLLKDATPQLFKKLGFQILFQLWSFAESMQNPQQVFAHLKLCFMPRPPSQPRSWVFKFTGRPMLSASSSPNPHTARLGLVGKWTEMEMGSPFPHRGTDCFLNYLKWWRKKDSLQYRTLGHIQACCLFFPLHPLGIITRKYSAVICQPRWILTFNPRPRFAPSTDQLPTASYRKLPPASNIFHLNIYSRSSCWHFLALHLPHDSEISRTPTRQWHQLWELKFINITRYFTL